MGRERKCILCEMVCSSKQEMDDHMRTMLHHRELEKLKGRDCGHECTVCGVTMVSLTDYAGHISSALHKQNVEVSESGAGGGGAANDLLDVDYFDQALVDLIEKRKELIRKEEEAAAAKRAREEAEQRRQEDFQERLREAKERFRLNIRGRQPPRGYGGPRGPEAWGGTHPACRGAEDHHHIAADHKAWTHGRQGKSATWHAQEPPNFKGCDSGEWAGGSLGSWKGYGGDKGGDKGAYSGGSGPRGRHPWLSNGGSSNGLYGRNNIPQYPQLSRPLNLAPLCSHKSSPPGLFTPTQFSGPDQRPAAGAARGEGHRSGDGPGECNRGNDGGPKSHGSNSKLDKACRWSPYPPTKSFEKEAPHPSCSGKYPDAAVPLKHETAGDGGCFAKPAPVEGEARHRRSDANPSNRKKKQSKNKKNRDWSSSESRSSSSTAQRDGHSKNSSSSTAQRDGHSTCSPGPSKQPADVRKLEHKDRKSSLTHSDKLQPDRTSTREKKQHKSESKTNSSRSVPVGPLQSRQEQQISELLNKSKEAALERRGSVEVPSERKKETAPPGPSSVEEPQQVCPESQVGANKENNCSQTSTKDPLPDLVRPSPCDDDEKMEAMPSYPDCGQYLQSVHISTSSTLETLATVVSSPQEDKEQGRRKERKARSRDREDGSYKEAAVVEECRSHEEQGNSSFDASDEAMAGEMSQSSESDVSRTNEASQNPSEPTAPGLTRLGLPPVLTKHMSSKSKTGSHEPNLNIARRVRNVSESRKGDSEKESGLKPTVRQLISSSGSRRNVNWEQVYQEVRKKQGQGKGWPRFGIEMVSYDHEEHTQEEGEEDNDMALLEGFQWDSLLDTGPSVTPRKRSLSESSVAPGRPGSSHSLFSCQISGDQLDVGEAGLPQPDLPGLEEHEAAEPKVFSGLGLEPVRGTAERPRPPDQEPGSGLPEVGVQRPGEAVKKGRVRVLQSSESVVGDFSSGMELLDAQAMGKKRRAAGDIPSPEIHSLKKNKRMKIKSKRERFQVDQLLAVSLREEELSLSLQTLDTSLIQARATLQAAYIEVQRIMVLKQQVATEMGTLRNQRIDLLKGMQGGFEDPVAQPQVKQENREFDSSLSSPPSTADVPVPSPSTHTHTLPPNQPAGPPASPPPRPTSTPVSPAMVKQEPLSPVQVSSLDQESKENLVPLVHSSTAEMPALLTSSLPDTENLQWSPDGGPIADQTKPPPHGGKDSSPDAGPMLDRATQADRESSPLDCKLHLGLFKSEESGAMPAPPLPPPPPSSEMKSGAAVKRVRKLRKRRALNKAQGVEQAAVTSDTEADEDATAKPRRLRPRRRSSAGSLVSTSTPPTAPEDEEQEAVEEVAEEEEEEEGGNTSGAPATGPAGEEEEFDSALEMVEVGGKVVSIDSSELEECMEVTMACQQPPAAGPGLGTDLGLGLGLGLGPAPASSRAEFFNLACNEVTSTSDMDTSPAVKPYQSEAQMPLAPPKVLKTKTSSDVSSDPGEDEAPTEGVFEGHQEAVNGLHIHKGLLYTCSGDRTVKAFDLVSHECVAVFEGHSSKVNCVLVSAGVGLTHRLYSGSSDQTIRCYSLRTRSLEQQFSLPDRVLCLHSRWKVLYAGLANGTVVTFNLKTNRQLEVFDCHGPRAVSCLSSAQEGARKVLLVGSYDSTISVRDARNGLLLRTLGGHTKTVLCMKVVNDLVFSGSSDQSVHAHNIHTGELVRIYKGHRHAVTVVAILGKVMLTASLDKLVRVYELQSHDRLQVYGGHKDMVMCMTVHKSMIYTGCYDGSVQAVKLNLLQNYRCMWHGCSLIFGVREHLQQHLADAHANPSFQTLKCRWRNCDEFFCARNGSKQGVLTHMQKHAEEGVKSDP